MESIANIHASMCSFFGSMATLPIKKRINALIKLKDTISKYESNIVDALYADLGKGEMESYITEISIVQNELDLIIKNLHKWSKPQKVKSVSAFFPSSSYTIAEPLGLVFVMSPWNYPFMLSLSPVIGAIAAGNCVMLRPSSQSFATSQIISTIISESFDKEHCLCIIGDNSVADEILEYKWDYIFFTGSVNVGKKIAIKAAEKLTPVTLELGGKSPTIVHKDANIKLSAKRIAWGKLINSGQTCVAPDYLYVHEDIYDTFIAELIGTIEEMYGEEPIKSVDYTKIISVKHLNRLVGYLDGQNIVYGGKYDIEKCKMEPTILESPSKDSLVMSEEIFGPIFPILKYKNLNEPISFIKFRPKPLSLYIFTKDKNIVSTIEQEVSFGGGAINDVLIHVGHPFLPFGGVGESGMGSYHGKYSFNTFSNIKGVVNRGTWIELPFRFAPFKEKYMKWIKRLM